jgi:hypothetical protein
MRFPAFAVVLGLGGLVSTPCLALTVQSAPPRPDIAQHLHSQTGPSSGVLPAPGDLKDSFLASDRPQLRQGLSGPASAGTTSFSFGPVHGAFTVAPRYGAFWNDTGVRENGNPLALTPPRP